MTLDDILVPSPPEHRLSFNLNLSIASARIAKWSGNILEIQEYTSTAGNKMTYDLHFPRPNIPQDSYIGMVTASKDMLTSSFSYLTQYKPDDIPLDVWTTAGAEMLVSYTTSLNKPEIHLDANTGRVDPNKRLVCIEGLYFYECEVNDPKREITTLILKNMVSPLKSYLTPESIPSGPVPRAKHFIRKLLPINNYVGQLNIRKDNIGNMAVTRPIVASSVP